MPRILGHYVIVEILMIQAPVLIQHGVIYSSMGKDTECASRIEARVVQSIRFDNKIPRQKSVGIADIHAVVSLPS